MEADYNTARIYAQEMLFRDMDEAEYNKYHKGKTRDQLFDTMRDAPERENKLAYWKGLEANTKPPTPLANGIYKVGL